MDLSSLRALVRNINFATHGIDVTIDDIATRGIWITPETEDVPAGFDLRRRERSYVLGVPHLDVELGAVIMAPASPTWADALEPPPAPGEILRWLVDGFAGVEADHMRLRVVYTPAEET